MTDPVSTGILGRVRPHEEGPGAAAPIAVFDSGVGGLSVAIELRRALPHEDLLYLADTAHCPYGARPRAEIVGLAQACAGWLRDRGAKGLVVACNTASAAALHELRAAAGPGWPIVGLVPAVKPAVEQTRTGRVVVLATPGTLQGHLLQDVIARFAVPAGVTVETVVSPGLVPAVETGALHTAETLALLRAALDPPLAAGADVVVLGCTHYPFLRPAIHAIYGPDLRVVDSGAAVARQAGRVLADRDLLRRGRRPGRLRLYTTGAPAQVAPVVARLLGEEHSVAHAIV